jgi:hypothetical protein
MCIFEDALGILRASSGKGFGARSSADENGYRLPGFSKFNRSARRA